MNIPVKQLVQDTYADEVAITVTENGVVMFCNHVRNHEEQVDFGYPDAEKGDYIERVETVQKCDRCGSIYVDGEWENEY